MSSALFFFLQCNSALLFTIAKKWKQPKHPSMMNGKRICVYVYMCICIYVYVHTHIKYYVYVHTHIKWPKKKEKERNTAICNNMGRS